MILGEILLPEVARRARRVTRVGDDSAIVRLSRVAFGGVPRARNKSRGVHHARHWVAQVLPKED